jgi:hypothetical protein
MLGKVNALSAKYWIVLSLIFTISLNSFAQDSADSPTIIYNKQMSGGLNIHSNGFGGFFQIGKYRGVRNILLFNVDLVTMKHEKEVKSYNPVYEDSRSYVYGKLNNFYTLRPMIGKKKVLAQKERRSGVQVAYQWMVGPTIGLTKPVYLEIGYPSIPYDYLSVEKYNPEQHFFDDIYGRASGLRGISELGIIPGASAKFGLNFEYSNLKDRMKGLEIGAVLDFYWKEVPIMAEEYVDSNRQYFLTLYLNIFFGKKYIQR